MMDQKAIESAKQVLVTRVFHVPVESEWKAWTEPGRVMLWWGPTGFTTPLANISGLEECLDKMAKSFEN